MKKQLRLTVGLAVLCAVSTHAALIAHWSFDDTLTNSVGAAYAAVSTGSGTPQYSTDAKYGKSLFFTNPDDAAVATNRLTIADGGDWAGSSNWTFSAWIKPTTLDPAIRQTVFSAVGNSGNYTLYSQLRNTQIITYYKDDGGTQRSDAASWGGASNEWYRLTVVFDAANGKVTQYRDSTDGVGGLVLLGSSTNYVTPMTLSNFQLGFVGANFGFQGYMDDVRIYDTALSQTEVDTIPEPVASIGLIAQWSFDGHLNNSVSGSYRGTWAGSGSPAYSLDAKYGKSLLFTNPDSPGLASNKVEIADGGGWAGSSDWTFSAWIKPTRLGPDTKSTVFSASGGSGNYTLYSQLRDSNQIRTFYNDDGAGAQVGTYADWGGAVGEWYRLTVVFDAANGTVTQYRDSTDEVGGLVLLGSSANYAEPMTLSNFQLGFVDSRYFGFQGYMDDVRIYDYALSESEVDALPAPGVRAATIRGISAVSSDVVEIAIFNPDPGFYYNLKGKANLTGSAWTNWPHSDDGVNPFVVTNLDYSSHDGTNKLIYVEAVDATAFFRVDGEP